MHLVILSEQFPPASGAAAERSYNLAKFWQLAGHQVTVITSKPNYILGSSHTSPEMAASLVRVIRLPVPLRGFKPRFVVRLLQQLTFVLLAFVRLLICQVDVFLFSSPPFFTGYAAVLLKWLRNKPYVFEVRDLYPESAIAYGKLRNQILINFFNKSADRFYSYADLVVGVTEGIVQTIQAKKCAPRLICVKNGIDESHFFRRPNPQVPTDYIFRDHWVVLYLGLMGYAQDLDQLLESAKILRDTKKILFLLVGDGPEKIKLIEIAKRNALENVVIRDPIPRALVPDLLSTVQLGVSPRRGGEINVGALPVKVFEYLACELPVVVSPHGESSTLVEKIGVGKGVPSHNPQMMAEAILAMYQLPARDRQQMGRAGANYVREHYSRKKLAAEYLREIESALAPSIANDVKRKLSAKVSVF